MALRSQGSRTGASKTFAGFGFWPNDGRMVRGAVVLSTINLSCEVLHWAVEGMDLALGAIERAAGGTNDLTMSCAHRPPMTNPQLRPHLAPTLV